jgi:hypothetical protein
MSTMKAMRMEDNDIDPADGIETRNRIFFPAPLRAGY